MIRWLVGMTFDESGKMTHWVANRVTNKLEPVDDQTPRLPVRLPAGEDALPSPS